MDKALRPDRFDCMPNTPSSAKEFSHWHMTLENFLSVLPNENLDKLKVLVNFLTPSVYEYINECTTYDTAIEALKTAYIKPTNEVFARHLLSVRKQQPGETLDEFLQSLKILSKDCNFKPVSAIQYQEDYIRDSFISGIQSNNIRQRLLENNTKDLKSMFDQARSLEIAQKSVEAYSTNQYDSALNAIPSSQASSKEAKCWNCGNDSHPKSKCPARESVCYDCGRRGHFAKLCRSAKKPGAGSAESAAISFPTLA